MSRVFRRKTDRVIYYRQMSNWRGSPCKDGRLLVGANHLAQNERNILANISLILSDLKGRTILLPSPFPKIHAQFVLKQFEAMNKQILILEWLVEDDEDPVENGEDEKS